MSEKNDVSLDNAFVRRRCAVIGNPVMHSLSPVMHRVAYAKLGLNWTYDAINVNKGGVAGFIQGMGSEWRGLSVTMPLKPELLLLPGVEIGFEAKLAGCGNTLIFDTGKSHRRVRVENTDASGFTNSLRRNFGRDAFSSGFLLGSGATAHSAVVGLAKYGVRHLTIAARSLDRAILLSQLATSLSMEVRVETWPTTVPDGVGIVINTIPGSALAESDGVWLEKASILYDVSYNPWPSRLAVAASRIGQRVLDGIDLLSEQAALQVELLTGEIVDSRILYEAARARLMSQMGSTERAGLTRR